MTGRRLRAHRRVRCRQAGLVGTCFLLSGLLGPIWHVFAIVLVDLERAFGGSRLDTSLAFSIFALSHALSTPLLAWALVRFDSRRVMACLALLLAAGLYLASGAASLWQFYFYFGVVAGIGTQAFGSYFVFSLIANRVRRRTGASMALADAGAGVGIFIGLPLLYRIQEAADWRAGFVVLAAMVLAAGPAAHLFLLPRLRLAAREAPDVRRPAQRMIFVSATLASSMLLGTIVLQALQTHQVAAFEAFGAPTAMAVWTISIAGLTVFISRLAIGLLVDRWGPSLTMAAAALGAALAFLAVAMFAESGVDIWLFVYPFAFALGFGAQGIIYAARQRLLLTPREFLGSLSLTRLSAGIGLFAGPVVGATAYEAFGGYGSMFLVLCLIACIHFCLFFVAGRLAREG